MNVVNIILKVIINK